jgi:predicted small lipoprotein YifL
MKKLTKSVLAILVVASSISACKKGDDDPGLSL